MINAKAKASKTPVIYAKVDSKSEIDAIVRTFDCYNNEAQTDECILDLSDLEEDSLRAEEVIEVFGKELADTFMGAIVIFHG
jgi:SepF-like predicted cell division protein (DUF552 family)